MLIIFERVFQVEAQAITKINSEVASHYLGINLLLIVILYHNKQNTF